MPGPLAALLRALVVWLLIIAAASLQGAARHLLLSPEMQAALRQASVVAEAVVIFAITWVCMSWLRIRSMRGALGVGLAWVALTVAFELGLGRLMGASWPQILSDYDLAHGGLMPLGLLAMGLTPWAVRRLQAHGRDVPIRTAARRNRS
jgi:hypothetical protein